MAVGGGVVKGKTGLGNGAAKQTDISLTWGCGILDQGYNGVHSCSCNSFHAWTHTY